MSCPMHLTGARGTSITPNKSCLKDHFAAPITQTFQDGLHTASISGLFLWFCVHCHHAGGFFSPLLVNILFLFQRKCEVVTSKQRFADEQCILQEWQLLIRSKVTIRRRLFLQLLTYIVSHNKTFSFFMPL